MRAPTAVLLSSLVADQLLPLGLCSKMGKVPGQHVLCQEIGTRSRAQPDPAEAAVLRPWLRTLLHQWIVPSHSGHTALPSYDSIASSSMSRGPAQAQEAWCRELVGLPWTLEPPPYLWARMSPNCWLSLSRLHFSLTRWGVGESREIESFQFLLSTFPKLSTYFDKSKKAPFPIKV